MHSPSHTPTTPSHTYHTHIPTTPSHTCHTLTHTPHPHTPVCHIVSTLYYMYIRMYVCTYTCSSLCQCCVPPTCSQLLIATVFDREVNCRKAASVSVDICLTGCMSIRRCIVAGLAGVWACVRVCHMCVYMCVCVCVYPYIYVCVCMHVCRPESPLLLLCLRLLSRRMLVARGPSLMALTS